VPEEAKLAKASLQEIRWDNSGTAETKDAGGTATQPVEVQFNPQSLKIGYSNQKAGGDQPKGSALQFVGKGVTKLSCELVFDITVLEVGPGNPPVRDVRRLTARVSRFMEPKSAPAPRNSKSQAPVFVPPGVRFQWGDFRFDGVMDSVDETIDFFAEDGNPLRATMSIAISSQEIKVASSPITDFVPFRPPMATNEFKPVNAGDTVSKVAGKDYKQVAAANGIENPRLLPAGSMLDLSGTVRLQSSLGLSARAELSISGGFGVAQAGVGVSLAGALSAGAGVSAGLSLGGGVGLGIQAGATASEGFR
jgi:hypothetical protein